MCFDIMSPKNMKLVLKTNINAVMYENIIPVFRAIWIALVKNVNS